MKRIYMDHNATTAVSTEVLEAMMPYFRETFGNASSIHSFGREAKTAIENAREQVAKLIGADPPEVVFTSGGTESDNLAIKGVVFAKQEAGKRIITSNIEHPAVLNTCQFMEKQGYDVVYLPVDKHGVVDLAELEKAINDDTILITVMHSNNEIGTIQPIEEIGKIAAERKVTFHTDAVQSVGKVPIEVNELQVDLLSLSGHKIYGPKGVGVLYIKKGTKISPLQLGGHHERNRRAGTENVAGVVGLGKACEVAMNTMDTTPPRIAMLRDRLQNGLLEKIENVYINGHPTDRLPTTLSMSFQNVEGESMILMLDMKGVAVSSGSACTSASLEPSHVLLALDMPYELAHASLRFSLGKDNTEEDVDFMVDTLPEIVERLRSISVLS